MFLVLGKVLPFGIALKAIYENQKLISKSLKYVSVMKSLLSKRVRKEHAKISDFKCSV